jgi:hypothetical protein
VIINFDRLMDGLWIKLDEYKNEQKEADEMNAKRSCELEEKTRI